MSNSSTTTQTLTPLQQHALFACLNDQAERFDFTPYITFPFCGEDAVLTTEARLAVEMAIATKLEERPVRVNGVAMLHKLQVPASAKEKAQAILASLNFKLL